MAQLDHVKHWARIGAATRLAELNAERAAILRAYPDLTIAGERTARRKRTMSPEARKRMSAGMRRWWAKRKAAAAK